MSFLDDAISTVGRGLAQTAAKTLSDATGFDVGGTLNVLFGNDQKMGGQDLTALEQNLPNSWTGAPAQLQMLQSGLEQQTQLVSDLGTSLSALAVAVDAITGQIGDIESMLDKIGQGQLYQEWQAIDSSITPYLASVQTSFTTYGEYIADFAETESTLVIALTDNIINTNDGPRVALTAISKYIIDDGQARGVLQLWSTMVAALVAADALDYRDATDQYFAYYQKLAYAQLQATNLLMEAYNFLGDGAQAKKVWNQYRAYLLAQEDTFVTWLVPLVTAGVAADYSVPTDGTSFSFSCLDASMQLNPGLQRVPKGRVSKDTASNGYYAPSPLFQRAEALLATLYVTEPADRRIVVHMLYDCVEEISSLLSGVNLTLSSSDAATEVAARRSSRLGAPFPYPYKPLQVHAPPDPNLITSGFFMKRYVFSAGASSAALADNTYSITNINGQDGLLPMETYLSEQNPNPAFMNQNVLSQQVSVDGAKPFDFMNFMAYMVPVSFPSVPY